MKGLVRVLFLCVVTCLGAVAEPPVALDALHTHDNAPIRVACIGASITHGVGAAPHQSYPEQLQALLGPGWVVKNFGVSGRTVLKKGDHPYLNEKACQDAQAFQPDVVIILLGSNDTKAKNWIYRDDFVADYTELIETFRNLPTKPTVYACLLPPVPEPGNYGINEKNLDLENPMIDQVATAEKSPVIDMHTALAGHPELFPDHVHPNTAGAALIAQAAARALTGK